MSEKELKSFPGGQTGIIQILVKHSEQEEAIQLRFEFDFDVSSPTLNPQLIC